jgi:hypothetical protein
VITAITPARLTGAFAVEPGTHDLAVFRIG